MSARRLLLAAMAAALTWSSTPGARADAYPDRPIRLIVNSAVGGGLDVTARLLAEKLAEKLGKAVIVDNRPGAGGVMGAAQVAKSPPDGYTLIMVSAGYSTLPALHPNLPFSHADLAPVAVAVDVPFIIVTSPSRPYKTLGDFIADAKARPGLLNFASGGNATAGHLLGSWLKLEAGIDLLHIPFKGEGPALQAVMGDQVAMMPVTITTGMPLLKSGRLRPLAISGQKRSPLLPDVPTLAEAGVPISSVTWFGMLAPAGVPKDIVTRLNRAVNQSLQDPALRSSYIASGVEVVGGSQEDFRRLIEKESQTWARVLKDSGIKAE
jgi:tripartite-type tricarboxylate transporter receptor subunit TctC